jgi:arylformamidase
MPPANRLYDVSVPLTAGLPAYPGNPEFELQPVKRIADGASSNVSRLVIGTHSGTHVDAPRHFFDQGAGVEAMPLDVLVGRARVLEFDRADGITMQDLESGRLDGDERILLKTANSSRWNEPEFYQDYAYLAESGARYLVDRGVRLVGIDYLSIEQFKKPGAPAHRALLSAGVIIIEGLNLSGVGPGVYEMYCLPLPVTGADGAPARVVLKG